MEVSEELLTLAKEFKNQGHTLYIVGGHVRDSLLGLKSTDIDISSNMNSENVVEICKKLKFKTNLVNRFLGTILIKSKHEEYEYTPFRKESYSKSGSHTPDSIEFVEDIKPDCLRRDITINSLYYDILNDSIIDLIDGKSDLQKGIIRTTNSPNTTLNDDGLRILRIIRFASTYNFHIEQKTFNALKKYKNRLKLISKERILEEIKQLTVCDYKFNKHNTNFLNLLNKLNLLEIIFNHGLSRAKRLSKKDIGAFYSLSKDSRLIGLYVIILKNYITSFNSDDQLNYTTNSILGIQGIKESRDNIKLVNKLYKIYQNLEHGIDLTNASINYLTLSNSEREIINSLISNKTKIKLSDNISNIKDKNLPLGVQELNITAQDLIEVNIEKTYISKILSTLFNMCIELKISNTKDDLLKTAKDIDNDFKTLSKDIKKKFKEKS